MFYEKNDFLISDIFKLSLFGLFAFQKGVSSYNEKKTPLETKIQRCIRYKRKCKCNMDHGQCTQHIFITPILPQVSL